MSVFIVKEFMEITVCDRCHLVKTCITMEDWEKYYPICSFCYRVLFIEHKSQVPIWQSPKRSDILFDMGMSLFITAKKKTVAENSSLISIYNRVGHDASLHVEKFLRGQYTNGQRSGRYTITGNCDKINWSCSLSTNLNAIHLLREGY
jgi:hypothetical protein